MGFPLMSLEAQKEIVMGLHRFGLGARPGDISKIGSGLREALLEEILTAPAPLPGAGELPASAEAFHRLRMEQEEVKALREAKREADARGAGDAAAGKPDGMQDKPEDKICEPLRRAVRDVFQAETMARAEAAKTPLIGFRE